MAFDYLALESELTVDPLVRAYSGMSDQAAADDLNIVYRKLPVATVDGGPILNATNDAEYDALPVADRTEWMQLCAILAIDVTSGVAKGIEERLFGGGSITRTNLLALKTRDVSRGEELGLGTVTHNHVKAAREI